MLQHPLTVVIGDGGAGKTVAACDAVARSLLETGTPPGFGLIVRAPDANSQTLMETIARWRHLVRSNDGPGLKVSFQRLRLAFSHNPLLVICIDAIDEKPEGARLPAEAQQLVRQLIDDAVDEQQRLGMPVISIVLTCRSPEELHELVCSGFAFSQSHNRIDVSDFDEDELISLAGELDNDVGRRLTGHCQIRTVESERMHSPHGPAVSEDIMKSIRHPVLWRFFSDLDIPSQHACLNGSRDGLDRLAYAYLNWFRRKAQRRIGGLVRDACVTALEAVAEHFRGNPAGVGEKVRDWVDPCIKAGCQRLHAEQIFGEAMTAGLLIDAERLGRRWRWKHPWFCEYLCRTGTNE